MRIDLGAVDTGVFAHQLVADGDRNHARPAHPGGVDHDRVQARHGVHSIAASQVGDRAHHQRRADRHDLGDDTPLLTGLVGLEHVLQGSGHEAGHAEGTVVGGVDHVELITELGL